MGVVVVVVVVVDIIGVIRHRRQPWCSALPEPAPLPRVFLLRVIAALVVH